MTKSWKFHAVAFLDLHFDSTLGFTTHENLENETTPTTRSWKFQAAAILDISTFLQN